MSLGWGPNLCLHIVEEMKETGELSEVSFIININAIMREDPHDVITFKVPILFSFCLCLSFSLFLCLSLFVCVSVSV